MSLHEHDASMYEELVQSCKHHDRPGTCMREALATMSPTDAEYCHQQTTREACLQHFPHEAYDHVDDLARPRGVHETESDYKKRVEKVEGHMLELKVEQSCTWTTHDGHHGKNFAGGYCTFKPLL